VTLRALRAHLTLLLALLVLLLAPARANAQDDEDELPPGHPGVTGAPGAMGHPELAGHQTAPDNLVPAPELKTGTIEVSVLDADDHPVAGQDVRLGIMFNKVAEGESRSSRFGKTGPDGVARFEGLQNNSAYAYRVTVRTGVAEFAATPFNLKETGGMRVSLHVFPIVQDLSSAPIGIRGFFYIETRDEVFQVEGLFRVSNIGHAAWVPRDLLVGLPDGFKAFTGGESMFDSKFEAVEGRGARLVGTFPPGQRDLNFRFQVPKDAVSTAVFRFTPPPRAYEMRVIAVASTSMGLEVDGWEAPQTGVDPSGNRVLVTRKVAQRGQAAVGPFVVTLTGLPVPGPGRWIAIAIALAFVAAGAAAAAGKWRLVSTERVQSDRARACDLLLDELVALNRAKDRGEVGPQTHERTQRALMDALARIGIPAATKPRKTVRKPQRA
jgi:hypothetical protein